MPNILSYMDLFALLGWEVKMTRLFTQVKSWRDRAEVFASGDSSARVAWRVCHAFTGLALSCELLSHKMRPLNRIKWEVMIHGSGMI